MYFSIQASNPRIVPQADVSDEELGHVIEEVFAFETESAVLNWNGVTVALDYKYDFSWLIEDLLDLLSTILESDVGEKVVTWPSNTFRATWTIVWGEQTLTCTATWDSVSGGVQQLLANSGGITMSKTEFLSEWRAPLERVISGLQEAGANPKVLERILSVEAQLARLNLRGRLYR